MNCNQKVETQYIGEMPIDTLESIADFFLAERDILDQSTGNTIRSIVRVPSAKLFPQASMDNVVALEANNEAIVIPDKQVRAVYIQNSGSAFVMQYADTTHPPVYLALGELAGMILCQNCGTVNIPNGHSYLVGQQYYVGANGEPTTTASAHKLFIPVSSTKLAINM